MLSSGILSLPKYICFFPICLETYLSKLTFLSELIWLAYQMANIFIWRNSAFFVTYSSSHLYDKTIVIPHMPIKYHTVYLQDFYNKDCFKKKRRNWHSEGGGNLLKAMQLAPPWCGWSYIHSLVIRQACCLSSCLHLLFPKHPTSTFHSPIKIKMVLPFPCDPRIKALGVLLY